MNWSTHYSNMKKIKDFWNFFNITSVHCVKWHCEWSAIGEPSTNMRSVEAQNLICHDTKIWKQLEMLFWAYIIRGSFYLLKLPSRVPRPRKARILACIAWRIIRGALTEYFQSCNWSLSYDRLCATFVTNLLT